MIIKDSRVTPRMPRVTGRDFRNVPEIAPNMEKAARDLFQFFQNKDELINIYVSRERLGFNIEATSLKVCENPFRIVNSLVTIFGNLRTRFSSTPAGSI